jgi:hypothetical protein
MAIGFKVIIVSYFILIKVHSGINTFYIQTREGVDKGWKNAYGNQPGSRKYRSLIG